ncbi:nucleoside triphosphate hydrolase [Falsirhodobacter sp. 20TX0035]|nr:nucleoside triphosphate hydrolase [Falsirhodobacter sp. 20TX0035]MDB6455105.1 nucleoside triphosphate hydrolase [Falsirhodobacter sp. 20TX0035]
MTIEALAKDLCGIQTRRLIGIAGPPGAGKSTLAERLQARIPHSAILPMDGFHYDDAVLIARGHWDRKGAPHTFDVAGLRAMLHRLRGEGGEIAVPVFDRDLEISRAAARVIGPEVKVVLVEGNYLLLDDPDWAPLRPLLDMTVMLDVPLPVLEQRLRARWAARPDGAAKVEGNDLPNARRVIEGSVPADVSLPSSPA